MAENARIDDLRRRVQKDPASIAFAQLAEECRRAGQFQEAVDVCRAGLAIHPGYLSARVTLGRALLEINQLSEAQAEFEHVLRNAPENLAAIRGLAETYHSRGELSEALVHYRKARVLAPNDPDLQQTYQQLAYELGLSGQTIDEGLTLAQAHRRDELTMQAPPSDVFAERALTFEPPQAVAEFAPVFTPSPPIFAEAALTFEPPQAVAASAPMFTPSPSVFAEPALTFTSPAAAEPPADFMSSPPVFAEPELSFMSASRLVATKPASPFAPSPPVASDAAPMFAPSPPVVAVAEPAFAPSPPVVAPPRPAFTPPPPDVPKPAPPLISSPFAAHRSRLHVAIPGGRRAGVTFMSTPRPVAAKPAAPIRAASPPVASAPAGDLRAVTADCCAAEARVHSATVRRREADLLPAGTGAGRHLVPRPPSRS